MESLAHNNNIPNQFHPNHKTSPIGVPTGYQQHAQTRNPRVNYDLNGITGSPSTDSRLSGNSVASGYRPASSGSSGYRLAGATETFSDTEGYLAPRSSAGSYHQQVIPNPKPIQREHDSGVEIDRTGQPENRSSGSQQSVHIHNNGNIGWSAHEMPTSLPPSPHKAMPRAERPDSLAYRHDYEELPLNTDTSKYVYADVDEPGRSKLPSPQLSAETPGSQKTPSKKPSPAQFRRRQNPLYDSFVPQDSKLSTKSTSGGCNRCVCVSIIILALLSGLALVLALLTMSGTATWPASSAGAEDTTKTVYMVSTPSYAQLQQIEDQTRQLKAEFEAMQEKINKLETQVSQYEADLDQQNETITGLRTENKQQQELIEAAQSAVLAYNISTYSAQITDLAHQVGIIDTSFDSFRNEIRVLVSNINKIPGPQGRPGAGNLSLCETQVQSTGGQLSDSPLYTSWFPNNLQYVNNYVIMAVECSAERAVSSFLRKRNHVDGFSQYRCECSGLTSSVTGGDRYCEMYYTKCPRIS